MQLPPDLNFCSEVQYYDIYAIALKNKNVKQDNYIMDFDKATEMIDRLTSHERQLINCYTIYTTRPSSHHNNSLNSEKCAIQGSQNVILKFILEWQAEW